VVQLPLALVLPYLLLVSKASLLFVEVRVVVQVLVVLHLEGKLPRKEASLKLLVASFSH